MIWLFNVFALSMIAAIIWWFWLSKPGLQRSTPNGSIDIVVENGVYTPAQIEVMQGEQITLNFIRKDPGPCAEKVVFADLGVSQDLVLNEVNRVVLSLDKAGVYTFTCQMGMYRGKLLVT